MKFVKSLLVAAALVATAGANATVTGTLGGGNGSFLTLSGGGVGAGGSLTDGTVSATIDGGTVYHSDMPFADIPKGGVFGGDFLAAGPGPMNSEPATMTFDGGGVSYISFLWGSPDLYNLLTVFTSDGISQMFTAASLGFGVTDGDQSFSQYVQFFASAGTTITSLVFNNVPQQNAFEAANFSVTPIPEPETYALMLAGLGAVGFMVRRRRTGR